MYPFLHELLADRGGEILFTCVGLWHWGYILLAAAGILISLRILSRMDPGKREVMLDLSSGFCFGVYILDFFLMPLAYGYMDVEKLPFHVCTAMCVMCFLSRRVSAMRPYHTAFALLGFLSNFVYLLYPAGVMWHQVHPLCYRVIQTLLFHGIMTCSTLLSLLFGEGLPDGRGMFRVTLGMTLWALLGNLLYRGFEPEMNWFFLMRDPFYLLPAEMGPVVMPFLNTALFFLVQLLLKRILSFFRKRIES